MAWITCSMIALAPALAQSAAKDGAGSKKPPTEKQLRQQARFKDCSAQARGHKGDERKQLMRDCLSK
jgi:hypothetical protein